LRAFFFVVGVTVAIRLRYAPFHARNISAIFTTKTIDDRWVLRWE